MMLSASAVRHRIRCVGCMTKYFDAESAVSGRLQHRSLWNFMPLAGYVTDASSGSEVTPESVKKTENADPGSGIFLKKKYADTLLLPKTEFPMKISHEKRSQHELSIANKCQFEQLYAFQSLWRQGQPEFILHDGPPYANGNVHIGHAVNKILKDIMNRFMLLRGYHVNYVPGWDCHGLPIELKAVKDGKHGIRTDRVAIRNAARKIVDESIKSHIDAFRRWGLMAEWNAPYKTLDKSYIKTQLQTFLTLFEKGSVFRDVKPVFWSPSSQTALAEAELEYKPNHESPSVYVGFDLNCNVTEFLEGLNCSQQIDDSAKLQAIVWTTTPWTIPSNKAVAYNKSIKYSLLVGGQGHNKAYYIIASPLLAQFISDRKASYTTVLEFDGHHLSKFKYKHPWFENELCPFLPADHVTMDKGTGLVHTAPAHGQDDFVLGLRHNLAMDCYVDDKGNFDKTIQELKGLDVLTSGNKAVMDKLKNNILWSGTILHSYPYDWRTRQPVIVKTSKQWFINTEQLKSPALEALSKVQIYPSNVENAMTSMLVRRPYWCISRQRTWGVPIPVVYRKDNGEPVVNQTLIDHVCQLIDKHGNMDFWWDCSVEDLFPAETDTTNYTKGKDIFDIWYDSGVSWNILGGKVSDMYLEGKDQFQGWFQSSLLLSTALRGTSPYKNLYVHGFVVDETGRKMSKSVGNVVNPEDIVDGQPSKKQLAYGADVLRWWVAAQGSGDGGNIEVANSLIRAADDGVQKLRNVIKFLVSYCNEGAAADLNLDDITYDELVYTDQYMLRLLCDFRRKVTQHYEDHNYHRVLMKTLHFATTEVSAQYFTWIKDRLYCDEKYSQSRKSCIFVLNQIYSTFSKVLAPILPFLVEESYLHYKLGINNQSVFKTTWFNDEPAWENDRIEETFNLALDIRESLNHVIGSNNPKDIWVELQCDMDNFNTLQLLHPVVDDDIIDKCDSELCDILQVSGVDLKCYEIDTTEETNPKTNPLQPINFSIKPTGVGHSHMGYSVGVCKTELVQCPRCRRYCCTPDAMLCSRCQSVMKSLLQKQFAPPVSPSHDQVDISQEKQKLRS